MTNNKGFSVFHFREWHYYRSTDNDSSLIETSSNITSSNKLVLVGSQPEIPVFTRWMLWYVQLHWLSFCIQRGCQNLYLLTNSWKVLKFGRLWEKTLTQVTWPTVDRKTITEYTVQLMPLIVMIKIEEANTDLNMTRQGIQWDSIKCKKLLMSAE